MFARNIIIVIIIIIFYYYFIFYLFFFQSRWVPIFTGVCVWKFVMRFVFHVTVNLIAVCMCVCVYVCMCVCMCVWVGMEITKWIDRWISVVGSHPIPSWQCYRGGRKVATRNFDAFSWKRRMQQRLTVVVACFHYAWSLLPHHGRVYRSGWKRVAKFRSQGMGFSRGLSSMRGVVVFMVFFGHLYSPFHSKKLKTPLN